MSSCPVSKWRTQGKLHTGFLKARARNGSVKGGRV
jgi:hypothetical protein